MNLYFRVIYLFIASFFRPRISGIFDVSRLIMRVWPNDLDFNWHMNNGRYLTVMDLGRFDLILRNGLMKLMLKQKSVPILAAAKIRYRLPLAPLQKFALETRVIAWDEKWVFIEQRFIIVDGPKKDAIAAIALLKASFYDKRLKASVPTAILLEALNYTGASPEMPPHIVKWQDAEDALRDLTKS